MHTVHYDPGGHILTKPGSTDARSVLTRLPRSPAAGTMVATTGVEGTIAGLDIMPLGTTMRTSLDGRHDALFREAGI